jgi:glucose dehydrogenase
MSRNLNRRQLVGGATAATLASAPFGPQVARAQETGTPESEPESEGTGVEQSPSPAAEPPPLPTIPPELTERETNWAMQGQNLAHHRVARGSGISSETVGTLGLAWSVPIQNVAAYGSMVACPIVVGTTIYLQDAMSNVFAFDLETGEEHWSLIYDQHVPSGGPNGVAVAYGMVYFGVGGYGDVVAVNAETGAEVWTVNIGGPRREGIDMAPAVYDGVVYFSTIPGNPEGFYQGGQRGVLHALSATTGEVLWYFDTTTDNLWGNPVVNSGGGLWHPPSFDENGMLYAGTGNAGPFPGTEEFPNATSRPGDNDYCNSLISIDPATGGLRWYINVKPFDLFDLDNQLSPILTTATIGGEERNIVISSGKHGYVLAADRDTGEELWRTTVGKLQNNELTELPLDPDEAVEVFPGQVGGVETPMAYADGVVYVPVVNFPTWYYGAGLDEARADWMSNTGELTAIDVATGEVVWNAEIAAALFAGAAVVNDLIFTGGLDGVVRAFSTADGSQVWSAQTASGLNAPFAISGDYLLVPSGGFFIPSMDTLDPMAERVPAFHAYKLGAAEAEATPAG